MPVQKNPKKNKGDTSNKKAVAIIIIAVIVLVSAAVYFGTTMLTGSTDSTVNVSVPLIVTKLVRPSTGEEFNVQTLFSVKLDREARREITDSYLEETLTSIMLQMDIDRILGADKVDYINNRATELLKEHLADEDINPRVVVVDIATDDRITLTNPESQSGEIMKGLFQNMD